MFLLHHEGDATVCNKDGKLEVISNTFLLYKVLLFKGGDLCKADLDTCEVYKCFPGSYKGTCVTGHAEAGASCEDGNGCTEGDMCDSSGVCIAGAEKTCREARTCEDSVTCNSTTGNCEPTFTKSGDSCSTECQADTTCDGAGGCTGGTNLPSGRSCDDFDRCTNDDVCDGSGFCSGTPIVVVPDSCSVGQFRFTAGTKTGFCSPSFP